MKILRLVEKDIPIRVTGATLLSTEEASQVDESVLGIGSWWWLRSPAPTGNQCVSGVTAIGNIDIMGYFAWRSVGAVRPAIIVEAGSMKAGDRLVINGIWFRAVSETLALASQHIGFRRFDQINGDYEKSEIRLFVNRWFNEQIRPYC